MTWELEDGQHEGFLAPTFADGGLGGGSSSRGVNVTRIGDRDLPIEQWQDRPYADVIGWTTVCECGWRGPLWERVADPDEQDLAARKVYSEDGYGDDLEATSHAEWKDHVRPFEGLGEIAALARQHATIGRQLADAVARARTGGASWADVGTAAGMTRQSAHERWRNVSTPV